LAGFSLAPNEVARFDTSAVPLSAPITVQTLREEEYDEWERLVAASPDGSIYATPAYLDTLCTVGGGRFRILGVRRLDRIIGGLPLYERPSRKGAFVSPRLLLYYLGPVLSRSVSSYPSQQSAQTIATMGALADALGTLGFAKISLRGRHTVSDMRSFLDRGWTCRPSYSYVVPLQDLRGQWNRVEQNLRRLVDRCTEQNVTHTNDDDFESFLRLHRLTMSHHDAVPYLPDDSFRRWFSTLHGSGGCRLFHARLPSGESIAAQIVLLGSHPVSHTVCAAIDPEHRRLGAAAFLRWRTFEWLAGQGKSGNDLTDAALNSVTHFKSQLGGELVTNFVIETRGNTKWRAASAVGSAYSGLRNRAARIARRIRKSDSE
jgi:hypothetical protein